MRVRVVYDCLGSRGGSALWQQLRASGVLVRGFNPFRFDSPLGWLMRDHRKMISVDGRIGFVTGVCVSALWLGDAARRYDPWRDTGVEIRGPAVAELDLAFAQVWETCGGDAPSGSPVAAEAEGDVSVRVIAGTPNVANVFRLDQVVASTARK